MKILVLCLPGIGDSLMATPMIKLLREKYPNATIDVACMFDGVRSVYQYNPFIQNVIVLNLYKQGVFKGVLQLLRLRKEKYDISILAFPAYRREYHIVQWLIGAKKRIAHKFHRGYWEECNFLDTDHIPANEKEHNVINNLELLSILGIQWQTEIAKEDIRYDLVLSDEDTQFGEDYIQKLGWKKKHIVAIHPGSTDSKAALLRRWSIENYAQVAKKLISNGRNILIFVGPEERELGKKLYNLIDNKKHTAIVNTTFSQAVGVLNTVDLLVCNDNGFGHLAVALHKPIITLWASTNDKWSLPYNKQLVTLIRPNGYEPWYKYDLKREVPPTAKNGMEDISVLQVEQALNKKGILA